MDVLIVEDDETTRNVLEQILSNPEDLTVDAVSEGQPGVDRARDGPVDVVVLDYQLPDMTGLEVLEQLRELETPPAVIFLTGEGDESVAYRALSEGAVDYLVKDVEVYRRLPRIVRNAHDAWIDVEGVVQTTDHSTSTPRRDQPTPEPTGGDLDHFLERPEVRGLIVHDAQGSIVLSSLDGDGAELIATRSAALRHQTDQLAKAAHTRTRGALVLLRAEDGVIARAAAPDRLQLVALFDVKTTPALALDLVSRASRLVQDELSGDAPDRGSNT